MMREKLTCHQSLDAITIDKILRFHSFLYERRFEKEKKGEERCSFSGDLFMGGREIERHQNEAEECVVSQITTFPVNCCFRLPKNLKVFINNATNWYQFLATFFIRENNCISTAVVLMSVWNFFKINYYVCSTSYNLNITLLVYCIVSHLSEKGLWSI